MPKTRATTKKPTNTATGGNGRTQATNHLEGAARIDTRVDTRLFPGARTAIKLRPEPRADILKRLDKDGDLARLRAVHAPMPSAATKDRDSRQASMLLVRVTDRAGATRAGIPVVVEDERGRALAQSRTDAKGNVLVHVGDRSAAARQVRVRVLGAPGRRSRRVTLDAQKLAHRTDIRLSQLPARQDGQVQALGADVSGTSGLAPEVEAAVDEVDEALDAYQDVLDDPASTPAQVEAARAAAEQALADARAEAGGSLPEDVEKAFDAIETALEETDREKAAEAAEKAEDALEAARLAAARAKLTDVLERFRKGTATLEEVLAALGSGDLAGLPLGNDLFNQLPLDFAPEIFDLIVGEGLGLTDPIFAGVGSSTDFRRSRSRIVKRFSLPRHATTQVAETRYLVRFRQEWAFLGYTLGGLLQSEPLDPGTVFRAVSGARDTLNRTTSTLEVDALRHVSLETSRLLSQTSGVDGFLNTATSVSTQTDASGFARVGPRVSTGNDVLGGIIGGIAGFAVGGIPGAAAGAFLGSGGRVDAGGETGGTLLTSVNTTTGLASGVHSTLQVNNLLQSTQSVVDRQLRNLVGTLQGVQRTLEESTDRVSPLLDRVTNLLRWSLHENYAVLTQVEGVIPVRVIRLTSLQPLDAEGRAAAVQLLVAIQQAESQARALRLLLEAAASGLVVSTIMVHDMRDLLVTRLNRVDQRINGVRNGVDASQIDAGLEGDLGRADFALDDARQKLDNVNPPFTEARLADEFASMRGLSEALQALRLRLEDLLDNDQPLFKAADVAEYRRLFEPFLLEPRLAGRFVSLRRDLELKRAASLPVHRIDVVVSHTTVSAPADLRVTIRGVTATARLVPGQTETGVTIHFPLPVAHAALGSARFEMDLLATPPSVPSFPALPSFLGAGNDGPAQAVQSLIDMILRGMRANVTSVRFRYHVLEELVIDQVEFLDGTLRADGLDPNDTATVALVVPQPAVDPENDPLVMHVNRNKAHYFGLLLRAAMSEPTLRDDAPQLKAFGGDNPIWQLPILGFEGDRILLLDQLDPGKKDVEAATWLDEPGAATLVQVPAAGAYGEALQGLLQLGIQDVLHPALQAPLAPVMPPIAVMDLTGKRLVPIDVQNP